MDRDFGIVEREERVLRTISSDILWQCTCGLAENYIAPVGKQLRRPFLAVFPLSLISSDKGAIYGQETNSDW